MQKGTIEVIDPLSSSCQVATQDATFYISGGTMLGQWASIYPPNINLAKAAKPKSDKWRDK